jgi:hypothetical protein
MRWRPLAGAIGGANFGLTSGFPRSRDGGLSTGRVIIIEWIGSVTRNVLRSLAHDLDDLRNDIAPVAASGAPEQIPNCRVDRHLGIVVAGKIPIVFV